MAGNSFGQIFKLTTFGESHGEAIGGILDGCPAGLELDLELIQAELDRRKPGQSKLSSQRKESDTVQFLSGIFEGKTTGTPIGFILQNEDARSRDYSHIKDTYRPSHADYTFEKKYGIRDYRGGGRSSARETACRVVGGAIAAQLLSQYGIESLAYVSSVGEMELQTEPTSPKRENINSHITRSPDAASDQVFAELIDQTRLNGDTIGGTISAQIKGVPIGLGEPVFDKLHADLGKAMLSINAVKGFEIGSGFAGARMKGSEHNDQFVQKGENIGTSTNNSGGIQGGISNGELIHFRVAFKPVATIMQDQSSIDKDGKEVMVKGKGRHDPCVLPRAVPIVEAMANLVLADHLLRARSSKI